MYEVTDTVFRRIISDCAPFDLSMSEFVNVDGLTSVGRDKIIYRLDTSLDTEPIYAQLWGKKPENFKAIAAEIADGTIPGYAGIDINFGCPDKSVVKNECCSAMQQPHLWDQASEIISATMEGAGTIPVSIKTRLGFKDIDYGWHEMILRHNPVMLTVHVRTTKQMSKVPAQWEKITPIVELRDKISPDTKIILNGDIADKTHGKQLIEEFGVDGVMIGRGVFTNPYAFSEDPRQWENTSREDRIKLLQKQLELYKETYPNDERKFQPLKKFAKIYISDFPGASEFRAQLMESQSLDEMLELVNNSLK